MAHASILPFEIEVPATVLSDLQRRLDRTRWREVIAGAQWDYGTSAGYLQDLTAYWAHGFDWRTQEQALNAFAHFTATIDGVRVHFIHERGKGPSPTPIILTHGWPDSFYRFHKVVAMLTDPERHGGHAEDSFDVIVPSLPGYGFSQPTAMNSGAVADLWLKLMKLLGYERFVAAGGDVGAYVTMQLARKYPNDISAIHLTEVYYPTGREDHATLSRAERTYASFIQKWWMKEGAYAMVQSTKPQSIAYELNDSPVGLAAWMISMIKTGADGDHVEDAFGSRDELLTNIMIYWATQTAGSAARSYKTEAEFVERAPVDSAGGATSDVPAAIALFPRNAPFPREWAERFVNVQRFTKMPKGGHFSAIEEPELFAEDVRASVAELVAR